MSLQTHGKSDADAEHDLGEEYGETFILRAELRLGKRACVKHNDTVSCTYTMTQYHAHTRGILTFMSETDA